MSTENWVIIPRAGTTSDVVKEAELSQALRLVLHRLAARAFSEGLRFADRAPGQHGRDLTPDEAIDILLECGRDAFTFPELPCSRCGVLQPLGVHAESGTPYLRAHGKCSGELYAETSSRALAVAMLLVWRIATGEKE